jgi:hypothetical protein
MNVFNVHSQRSPVDGAVSKVEYFPGAFLNAAIDKASTENERNAVVIQTASGKTVTAVQIAGLIARRILCYVRAGEPLSRGQRYGFIRFGSRVDVYLPLGSRAKVSIGEKVSHRRRSSPNSNSNGGTHDGRIQTAPAAQRHQPDAAPVSPQQGDGIGSGAERKSPRRAPAVPEDARHLSAAERVHDRCAVLRLLRGRAGDERALRVAAIAIFARWCSTAWTGASRA